jgi:hypothetical protein
MGERTAIPRHCTCGARLARDNASGLCGPCRRKAADLLLGAPEVPAEFWEVDSVRDALAARHMGRVILAYRVHPHHGQPIPQETVGGRNSSRGKRHGRRFDCGGHRGRTATSPSGAYMEVRRPKRRLFGAGCATA